MTGADVRACLQAGATPLYIAARNGHLEVVKVLLGTEGGAATVGVPRNVSVGLWVSGCGERRREAEREGGGWVEQRERERERSEGLDV